MVGTSPADGPDGTPGASILGLWKTVDDKSGEVRSIARLYERDGLVHGRIERVFPGPGEDPDPRCEKCPDEKRDARVVGLEFLWGFRREGDEWVGGRVLDPENGKTYRGTLSLLDDGQKLRLYGYVRVIVRIGRSQVWERASEEDLEAMGDPDSGS